MGKTLKEIFNDNKVKTIPGFTFSFRQYPFKAIYIRPARSDHKNLLEFSVHDSYLCGMTYTSFATNYLYSQQFYEDSTLEEVISYIKSVYQNISEAIESTKGL